VGRDWINDIWSRLRCSFNPRARVGRDSKTLKAGKVVKCFNPRARVGRDRARSEAKYGYCVSIHAPAWGATPATGAAGFLAVRVSIHAPAWGATD